MGLREGKLIELLHFDPLVSRKVMIGVGGTRIGFDVMLAAHITVRPIKAYFEVIRNMAHYDHLTGCLNRHAAGSIIRNEVERFASEGLPLSLLMADIDHFKRINDTFGHDAGDSVLKHFSDIIRQGLRRSDLLCRWGGEEFLILLRGTVADEARRIADRFRERIADAIFHPFEGSGQVTVSFGAATVPPAAVSTAWWPKPTGRSIAPSGGRNRVALS